MKMYGVSEGIAPPFLTLVLNSPSIQRRGGWVGPRASMEPVEEIKISCSSSEPNPNSSDVDLLAHHYTNWAILTTPTILQYHHYRFTAIIMSRDIYMLIY
jgi:hypothetical protein